MEENLRIERLDHVSIARLMGELDLANAGAIEGAIAANLDEDRTLGLVADLSGVTFLDSSALRMLFNLHAMLAERGRSLVLVVPEGAPFDRVLEITGVADAIATCSTVDVAVEMLERRR